MSSEIESITVRFKDILIEGSLEDFRELRNELNKLFGKDYSTYIIEKQITYPSYELVWSSDTKNLCAT